VDVEGELGRVFGAEEVFGLPGVPLGLALGVPLSTVTVPGALELGLVPAGVTPEVLGFVLAGPSTLGLDGTDPGTST
jgi:hypothetical protein